MEERSEHLIKQLKKRMTKTISVPKYPRVMVSAKRHQALAKEAAKKGVSIAELAEAKFKIAK